MLIYHCNVCPECDCTLKYYGEPPEDLGHDHTEDELYCPIKSGYQKWIRVFQTPKEGNDVD